MSRKADKAIENIRAVVGEQTRLLTETDLREVAERLGDLAGELLDDTDRMERDRKAGADPEDDDGEYSDTPLEPEGGE